MSDIKCVVCGEPWDAYGVNHSTDMMPWETTLFKAGAGCPACEGVGNGFTPSSIFDLDNGDDDPILRYNAAERVAEGTKPEWKRPEDPILWKCDGCGVEAIKDLDSSDGELEYRVPLDSKAHKWYHSHSFHDMTPDETPEHTFADGVKVCPNCYKTCSVCNDPIPPGDDNGSFSDPRNDYHDNNRVCSEDCLGVAEIDEANTRWQSMRVQDRIEFMRNHESDFDGCFGNRTDPVKRWRNILANVRGKQFSGCASELIG